MEHVQHVTLLVQNVPVELLINVKLVPVVIDYLVALVQLRRVQLIVLHVILQQERVQLVKKDIIYLILQLVRRALLIV